MDSIDKGFDFGNYLDARNPETGEIILTVREDGKASGVELPKEMEMPQSMEVYPVICYLPIFMKSLKDMDFVTFCNALYFEIHGMMSKLEQFGFFSSDELGELEKNIACLGDKVIAGEDAAAERELISSTVYQLLSKMRDLLLDAKFQVKETLEGKLALELDVYIRKLIWRKWDTTYLEEQIKQENEIAAKVEADQVLVKKKSAELKAVMEGMSFNAFLVFHSKINELMKGRKATLIKYVFLTSEILNDHQRNWAGAYYWHNKEYDERQYRRFRCQAESLVILFYESILSGTLYDNHARTRYAKKIYGMIEELMNRDWSKMNETLK